MEQLLQDLIYASIPLACFFGGILAFALLLYFVGNIGPENVDDKDII